MLYLASQSPRRRTLLRQLRTPFRVVRSTYREAIRHTEGPAANVIRNAVGKARRAQLPRGATGVVIGADTLLFFQGRTIGKPRTMREARQLLHALGGKNHWVYTGLCVMDARSGRYRASYEKTRVTFKPLTPQVIAQLSARMLPLDKAGGYAVQASGSALIACIEGSRSNVIGLPMELCKELLLTFQWPVI